MSSSNRGIFWGTAVATCLMALGMAIAGVVYVVTIRDEAAASTRHDTTSDRQMENLQTLVGELRVDAAQTKTDVSWIRQFLEHPPAAARKEPPQTAAIR